MAVHLDNRPNIPFDPTAKADEVSPTENHGPKDKAATRAILNLDNLPMPASSSGAVSKADGGEALESLIEIKRSNNRDSKSLFRGEAQKRLMALAHGKLSPTAQADFIGYLDKHANLPDDAGKLTWLASKVFDLSRYSDSDVEPLRRWFYDHGMRLRPWDPLPKNHPGYQIDRKAFKARVRAVQENGGTITRRDALALLDQLKNCADQRDMFWAYGRVMNRVKIGDEDPTKQSALVFADAKSRAQFERFFEEKLPGRLAFSEIGLAMRGLRREGFSAAGVKRMRGMLDGCTSDDQAMFYAERAFHREVGKAMRKAPTAEKARLEKLCDSFGGYFDERLDGKFDRYAARKKLERAYDKGEISQEELLTMQAAALTSATPDEFVVGSTAAFAQMRAYQLQSQLIEAWDDIWDTISDNLSGDERDSNGNIIRTAEEIELAYRRERRLVEQLLFKPAKQQELKSRAHLTGRKQTAQAKVQGERDPMRRQAAENELAGADIALVDLDAPLEPKS